MTLLIMALAWVNSADAKMPYFSIAIDPEPPVAGEPATVLLNLWQDVAHTQPASMPVSSLPRLIALRSEARTTPDINPILDLDEASGTYRAEVIFPVAGRWTLVAFPDRTGWSSPVVGPGYPDTISITVVSPPSRGAGPTVLGADAPSSLWPFAAMLVAVVLLGLALLRRRRPGEPLRARAAGLR